MNVTLKQPPSAVATPPPRLVAAAIAELAAEPVRTAWRYLDEWRALSLAGVPLVLLRECLATPRDTEPLAAVRGWVAASEQGLLCITGVNGTGKSYALARWVLDRHRRGLWTHWVAGASLALLPIREREAAIAAVRDVRALVVDDAGAGAGQGEWLRDQLRGLFQHRQDALLPTGLASNGEQAELADWLGPRVTDRCRIAGGSVVIESVDSLRHTSPVKLDGAGRGPEWYAAHRIVELVGCEPVQRYDEHHQPLPHLDLDVGRKLDQRARMEGFAPCTKAVELLELDRRDVLAMAQRLAADEAQLVEWAGGTLGVRLEAASISLEGVAAAAAETIRERSAAQLAEIDRDAQAVIHRARVRLAQGLGDDHDPGPLLAGDPPAWTMGREGRRKLAALGFGVRGPDHRGDYAVFMTVDKVRVPKADRCATEDLAWRVAGLLCGELKRPLESDSAH